MSWWRGARFYTIATVYKSPKICQLKEHSRDKADNSPRYKTKYSIAGIVSSVSTDKSPARATKIERKPARRLRKSCCDPNCDNVNLTLRPWLSFKSKLITWNCVQFQFLPARALYGRIRIVKKEILPLAEISSPATRRNIRNFISAKSLCMFPFVRHKIRFGVGLSHRSDTNFSRICV